MVVNNEGNPETFKGSAINKFAELALRFRSYLFDPKLQNHRNSVNYFEDFAVEDRVKIA